MDADLRLRKLCEFARANPSSNLTLPVLEQLVGVNRRTLAMLSIKATGLTPAKIITAIRIDKACELLEIGDRSIEDISLRCGFGSREVMRRAFIRRFGMPPIRFKAEKARRHR
jgi:transcriptional regulator GlxA family with amidase domain